MTWIEKRRVLVPAGELAVVDAGDHEAPPVVLLSGGLTSSYVWRQLVPLLSPWMRVIAPDLLGAGESASPAGADLGLAVAQLHHVGYRHLTMWVAARDSEARARSLAGIDEFLGEPLLLPDIDALLGALG